MVYFLSISSSATPVRQGMRILHSRFRICLICLGLAGCNGGTSVEGRPSEAESESATPRMKVMDEEQRQLLWQIEHHGNVLNRVGFTAVGAALKKADERKLSRVTATGFFGAGSQQPQEVSHHKEYRD